MFAAKVPQVITHEKALVDCEAEFDEFIGRMDLLDERAEQSSFAGIPK